MFVASVSHRWPRGLLIARNKGNWHFQLAKKRARRGLFFIGGAPVKIRTSNLLIRSQMLYPVELRVLGGC